VFIMRSAIRLCFASTTLLFILFLTLMPSTSASSNQETAIFSISEADYSMAQAHEAVLDAEEVGADVSGLLDRLDVAGEYLAGAHIWYRLGNFENATRFAGLCFYVVEEVRSEAYRLTEEAYGLWVAGLFVRIVGSFVGVVVVVLLSYVVWRAFKRRYQRRILGLKLEVVNDGS
jgi:hypothetical protein